MSIKRKKPLPSIDRLRQLLEYNSKTGSLMWLVNRIGQVRAGDFVKTLNCGGYYIVGVDQTRLRAHRVAWAIHTGAWPINEIDHINGLRHDNRIVNLREIEHGANSQNLQKAQANNKSGLLGVCFVGGRWKAQITIQKKAKHIGYFDSPEVAYAAYLSMKRLHHEANTL